MSNTKNTGGPAFPRSLDASSGMSLRDHFAGLAMQVIISKMPALRDGGPDDILADVEEVSLDAIDRIREATANSAYRMADFMLKAREQ